MPLICPSCKHTESGVLHTGKGTDTARITRRRECLACKTRFTTHEVMATDLEDFIATYRTLQKESPILRNFRKYSRK